ncbi:MAG: hypothetical protein Kow0031_05600 [Anaerolineae bacterium]
MDLLKKVELLINAKTRSALPRRDRPNPLAEEEARLIAEIRRALGDVEVKERELAQRIKMERDEAKAAADRGDTEEMRTHKRRAAELESHLDQEMTFAIDLEAKLAALQEKLAQAQAAVENEARKVAERDSAAEAVLTESEVAPPVEPRRAAPPPPAPQAQGSAINRGEDLKKRKSRLAK